MTSHSTSDPYTTGHVGLACYLWYKGHIIVKRQWRGAMCEWTFTSSKELLSDIDDFYAGEGKVDAREYFPKVTEFKRKMYEDKDKAAIS